MLVVDSSVWIDFFNGNDSPERTTLRRLLRDGEVRLVVPDLVLFEVLRGFRQERAFRQARELLEGVGVEAAGGTETALEAARHYRHLRAAGYTVRKGIDVLIAAFCIRNGYSLLHRDRDFDAFVERGLRTWNH